MANTSVATRTVLLSARWPAILTGGHLALGMNWVNHSVESRVRRARKPGFGEPQNVAGSPSIPAEACWHRPLEQYLGALGVASARPVAANRTSCLLQFDKEENGWPA